MKVVSVTDCPSVDKDFDNALVAMVNNVVLMFNVNIAKIGQLNGTVPSHTLIS